MYSFLNFFFMYCYIQNNFAVAGKFFFYPLFSLSAFRILTKVISQILHQKNNSKKGYKLLPVLCLHVSSIWHKRQITFNDLGDAIFDRLLHFLQPLIVTSCRF